ncbi:hypothetical protein ZWY2020_030349 [Hordeum vulgare]|nr:hypothetical protein ZWY2020_030349 [Hordeum vulgare]
MQGDCGGEVTDVANALFSNQIDDFDTFKSRMLKKDQPYKRALIFVDNAGVDVVLGMLPLAREFLRGGVEVVLVANSLPALNDITANELPEIVVEAAKVSSELAAAAKDADLLILEGMGWSLHTNLNACFKCDALKIVIERLKKEGLIYKPSFKDINPEENDVDESEVWVKRKYAPKYFPEVDSSPLGERQEEKNNASFTNMPIDEELNDDTGARINGSGIGTPNDPFIVNGNNSPVRSSSSLPINEFPKVTRTPENGGILILDDMQNDVSPMGSEATIDKLNEDVQDAKRVRKASRWLQFPYEQMDGPKRVKKSLFGNYAVMVSTEYLDAEHVEAANAYINTLIENGKHRKDVVVKIPAPDVDICTADILGDIIKKKWLCGTPKHIHKIKDFLLTVRGKDARSMRIKRTKDDAVKFKERVGADQEDQGRRQVQGALLHVPLHALRLRRRQSQQAQAVPPTRSSDPIVQLAVLLGGSTTIGISYWLFAYGGYSVASVQLHVFFVTTGTHLDA